MEVSALPLDGMKRHARGGARLKIQPGHVEASSTVTYLACRPHTPYVVTLRALPRLRTDVCQ